MNDITSTDIKITDLWRDDDLDQFRDDNPIRCEYSANEFCWSYQRAFLRVMSLTKKGESRLLAKFNFQQLLKDKTLYINTVTQFKDENYLNDYFNFCKFKLLVSLNREGAGSYLLIIDVQHQSIMKCIECPFSIRNVEPIANNSGKQDENLPFCSELKFMCGIVALSTTDATVMVLDLCLDTLTNERFDINTRSPSTVTFVVKKDDGTANNYQDLDTKRKLANVHNQHICMTVNDDCIYKGKFRYSFDEEDSLVFNKEDVYISALKYFYQTNTLYIGYNFGGVHHFDLRTFSIYKTDSLESEDDDSAGQDNLPIVGFSLQEPENDPKNFCYLWIVKGQLVQDFGNLNEEDSQYYICSSVSVEALEFENKDWIDNYGYLYSGFVNSSPRFNYLFTCNTFDQIPVNSIIVNYGVINQGSILSYRKSKEDTSLLDTSLFYTVWQAFDDQIQTSVYYLMIFDLNQWYQAQMPDCVRSSNSLKYSPFMSFYRLNDIVTNSGDLQDVIIDSNSFSRYQQTNNDIFYFPCSLSFKASFLSETKHVDVAYLGIQKRVLKMLHESIENIWLVPDEFLNQAHDTGLISSEEMNKSINSTKLKLEQILSIALDNNELPFLSQTITSWSTQTELDKYGCNCKLFLDWLWNQVEEIKNLIDLTVVPLFDLSDTYDAKLVESPLYAYESKLKCLLALLKKLKSSGTPTTEQGERELELRLEIIQILIDFIQVILWCCSCNLLPEVEEGNHLTAVGFTYPRTQFQADLQERRRELVSLNPSLIKNSDLLAIDGLILNTPQVHELWKTNDNPTGLYPPPSIYSLVSIYLDDSVSTEIKHQIMLYSLLDLISYLSDRQDQNLVEKLETFQSCFNIDQAIVQSIRGMWALDHKLFDYSLEHFCEANSKLTFPNAINDFKKLDDDLQKRILTSYLYQNKKFHSLQFIKISNLFNCDTLIKQKLYISVMLSNKLVMEAYDFQRVCRNKENVEELLFHFFLGCEQMKLFESVFKFALDPLEKDTLIYYLLEISESVNSGNLLIVYLLLNKKFVDAHKFLSIIEERLRKRNLDQDNNYSKKFSNIRSQVNSYIQVLPSSVVKLSIEVDNHAENAAKKKSTTISLTSSSQIKPKHVQITRSASVNEDCSNVTKEILSKIEKLSDDHTSNLPATPFRNRIKQRGLLLSENSPFVKDLTPKKDNTELKNSLIANYSLTYNNGDNSFIDNQNIANNSRLDTSRNTTTENCSDLLSLLNTPKINKQQRNLISNVNPSVSGPSSILKAKQIMNPLTKSSARKKKSSHVNKLSFQQLDDRNEVEGDNSMIIDVDINHRINGDRIQTENFNDMSIDVIGQSNLLQDENYLTTPPPSNLPFVFSPPLTRSRKKQSKHSDIELDYHNESYSALNDSERRQDEKKSTKKTIKRSTTKTPSKPETKAQSKSSSSNTVETPTHKMSLRGTRVPKKH